MIRLYTEEDPRSLYPTTCRVWSRTGGSTLDSPDMNVNISQIAMTHKDILQTLREHTGRDAAMLTLRDYIILLIHDDDGYL